MGTRGRLVFALCAAAVALPAPVPAQQFQSGLTSDTVTVGDVFRAALRVRIPAGYEAVFPDTLAVSGDLENAGRRFELVDTVLGGLRDVSVMYPLTAWRPGEHPLPPVRVRLIGPAGEETVMAGFPAAVVRSVLPVDTVGLEPRPARDVLGPDRALWPLILGALVVVALAVALAVWLARRRAVRPEPAAPEAPPRERALAALDRVRRLGLLEAGHVKDFYVLTAEAVRRYLAELEPGWSADLTTSELLARFHGDAGADDARRLSGVLLAADLVKFAGRRPPDSEAVVEWRAAREWVASFDRPAAEAEGPVAEAEVA